VTILYILLGLVIGSTMMLLAYRQHNRHLGKIDDLIKNQAKNKGLKIKTFTHPTLKDWKDEPFDKEIKIGTLGLSGFPSNLQHYRILDCIDVTTNLPKTFWVKVTNNQRTKTLTTEWRESTNAR
jgi:hypothetical protein